MSDRAKELAEAFARSSLVDPAVNDICRVLLIKWNAEDQQNDDDAAYVKSLDAGQT